MPNKSDARKKTGAAVARLKTEEDARRKKESRDFGKKRIGGGSARRKPCGAAKMKAANDVRTRSKDTGKRILDGGMRKKTDTDVKRFIAKPRPQGEGRVAGTAAAAIKAPETTAAANSASGAGAGARQEARVAQPHHGATVKMLRLPRVRRHARQNQRRSWHLIRTSGCKAW